MLKGLKRLGVSTLVPSSGWHLSAVLAFGCGEGFPGLPAMYILECVPAILVLGAVALALVGLLLLAALLVAADSSVWTRFAPSACSPGPAGPALKKR